MAWRRRSTARWVSFFALVEIGGEGEDVFGWSGGSEEWSEGGEGVVGLAGVRLGESEVVAGDGIVGDDFEHVGEDGDGFGEAVEGGEAGAVAGFGSGEGFDDGLRECEVVDGGGAVSGAVVEVGVHGVARALRGRG